MYGDNVYKEYNFRIVSVTNDNLADGIDFVNYLKYGFFIVIGFGFYIISRKK